MLAIRVKHKLTSETLHLPELRPLVGKNVEIIVLADGTSPEDDTVSGERDRYPLRGSVIQFEAPFESAVAPMDWQANR